MIRDAGMPVGRVNSLKELVESEQVHARGALERKG